MDAKELKDKFIEFFKTKNHAQIPSASLIPSNDATVLFNTAGMQPLVPFLMGQKHPLGTRLVNVQKCLRTVDFEEVGDNTHHTFFQMLGNWSLGDYFKKESIEWSFEFLTSKDWLNLPLEKLSFTVYEGDDQLEKDSEAAGHWERLGVPKEKITFLGKDNLWNAGETGPCGPSTEIFYWTGDDEPKTQNPDEDERWVEIWNNVFMAFDKKADGTYAELPNKNVDTGMGLERTLAVLTGKKSAYETDLFSPLISEIEKESGKAYGDYIKEMRIIADHIRAAVFLLGDDNPTLPSNVDQGYILRRMIRKSILQLKKLGVEKPLCAKLGQIVVAQYSDSFPELAENKERIGVELRKEEEKFSGCIEKGLAKISKKITGFVIQKIGYEKLKEKGLIGNDARILAELESLGLTSKEIELDSKWLFDMFQSQGMPPELVFEEIESHAFEIPNQEKLLEEFQKLFIEHQEKSRAGAEQKFKGGLADNSEQTVKLHTATHLLNEALRKVIDKNITQKGSNITPQRLRFDFNFDRKLTDDEIKAVESEVNAVIQKGVEVTMFETTPDEAKSQGAQSEFGMRYPDKVSVYQIGEHSTEICMGPHVKNTKDIGHFKIIKEQSSAAGVRRIKAIVE